MPFTKDASSNNDSSGLHDLQAMASSAKKRRSQRLSSQMDAQDSLLQSSAALDAVVLPDPNKEQAAVSIAAVDVPATGQATASASALTAASVATAATPATELSVEKSSSGKGLYIGLALAAAVAAGAFFMLGGQEETVTEPAAVAEAVVPAAADPAPVPEMIPAPVIVDETEDADGETEVAAEPEPAAVVLAPVVADEPTKVTKKSAKATKSKSSDAKATKTKVAAAAKEKKAEPVAKAEKKPAKKLDETSSLDDVLSSVTGGVDKPIAKKTDDTGPSKEQLSRGDVAKAMKKISPAAKGCFKAEEFSGMVKVKYSVGSDGSVTKAAASGAHASSKTGQCVVKAVKKAKFPPFSGATMSFTFPFLLSP